jgi:uncharacterized membrane protein
MTSISPDPRPAWPVRLVLAIPVIGTILREIAHGDRDTIWYALVIVLTGLVLAVGQWGPAALVLFCLPVVAVMFVLLVVFSRPW